MVLPDERFVPVQPVKDPGERGGVVLRGKKVLDRPVEQFGQRPTGEEFGVAVETGDATFPVEMKNRPGVFGATGFRGQECFHGQYEGVDSGWLEGGGTGQGTVRCAGGMAGLPTIVRRPVPKGRNGWREGIGNTIPYL